MDPMGINIYIYIDTYKYNCDGPQRLVTLVGFDLFNDLKAD